MNYLTPGNLLIICFLIIINFSPTAAQKISVSLGTGYSLKLASQDIPDGTVIIAPDGSSTSELITFSYGAGWNIESLINYHASENILLGVGFSYLNGAKVTKRISHSSFDKARISKGSLVRFVPQIRLQLPRDQFTLYSSFGYVIGIGRINLEIQDTYFDQASPDLFQKIEYTKGISHGFMSAIGSQLHVNSKLSLFVEAKVYVQSYGPKKGEVTVATEDGIDLLPQLTTSEIFTDFKNEVSNPANVPIDPNRALEELRRFYPFSSIGLNAGIFFSL